MWTKTYKVVGFLEPGVVRFGDKGLMIYISKETIERYSYRLKGKPVTIGHIEGITEENAQEVSVGDVAVCSNPGECIVTINNEEAEQRISNGERFSCCWIPIKWGPAGTWHNVPYDRELVEMDFTHLAIVPDPRYENVEVFMNSKEYKNQTLRPRNDDAGPGFSRASADSQTKVARAAQKSSYNVNTFSEQSKSPKGVGGRKIVKVSSFQNSLNPKQYAFLKKYVKEWNNASFKIPSSKVRKPDWNKGVSHRVYDAESRLSGDYNEISAGGKRYPGFSDGAMKMVKQHQYNNEAQPSDRSSERMSRINAYLQKREDRRMDRQYRTQEAPKQFVEKTSTHFSGYKNACGPRFRYKNGKEFNNESFRKSLYSAMSKKQLSDNMMIGRQVQNEYKEGVGTNLYGGQSGKLKVTKGFNK